MPPTAQRLRVGLDQRLAAYRTGGISRYTRELGNALGARDDIDLVPIKHRSDRSRMPGDVTFWTPPHHRLESVAIGVERALRRESFDGYHATDFIAPRLLGCPVIVTIHDLAFIRWPDQLNRDALRYYRQAERQGRRVAHWIAPSAWTKSELIDLVGVPESDITVIPHGVSSFLSRDGIVPRSDREAHLVAVGTVEPRKRYDLLLDAYERMQPQPELFVVGEAGWNTERLQLRLASTPGVTWLDRASDADIDRLLSNALALAIPSLAEGFGLGALEAMARGAPVVSSGLGALSEVTGEAAIVPERDDPESWVESLEAAIHDEDLWQRCSEAGIQRAREFTWRRSAQHTVEVYHQIAG